MSPMNLYVFRVKDFERQLNATVVVSELELADYLANVPCGERTVCELDSVFWLSDAGKVRRFEDRD